MPDGLKLSKTACGIKALNTLVFRACGGGQHNWKIKLSCIIESDDIDLWQESSEENYFF